MNKNDPVRARSNLLLYRESVYLVCGISRTQVRLGGGVLGVCEWLAHPVPGWRVLEPFFCAFAKVHAPFAGAGNGNGQAGGGSDAGYSQPCRKSVDRRLLPRRLCPRALIGPSRGYCRRDGDGGGGWVITDMQRYSV
jgi:hypothetical protein